MRIGLFTDPHFSSASLTCGVRKNSESLAKIRSAVAEFENLKCDILIALGDMTDTEPTHEAEVANLRQISEIFSNSTLKTFCLMGNHDAFVFTQDEFYSIVGEHCKPETHLLNGVSLLFLDACHFSSGAHYAPGDSDWTDTFYPFSNRLRDELDSLDGEVIVFLHQNIDPNIPENHRLSNDAAIRSILEQSGKVKTVYQGHFHPGAENRHNGIRYVTLPAMCENDHSLLTIELP